MHALSHTSSVQAVIVFLSTYAVTEFGTVRMERTSQDATVSHVQDSTDVDSLRCVSMPTTCVIKHASVRGEMMNCCVAAGPVLTAAHVMVWLPSAAGQ